VSRLVCWLFGHRAVNLEVIDAAKDLSFIEVEWQCERCYYTESEELYTYKLNLSNLVLEPERQALAR
jgi:hypothetical protein